MSERKLVIAFAVFPGVTQLDFTGPHQVFSILCGSEVIVASVTGGTLESSGGLAFAGLQRLADISACDIICVPGGRGITDNVIRDETFLGELRRLAATAQFVTSVCTGSLALDAAGLLRGKRAACHWAWRDTLALFGAIPDPGRVVRDCNIVTGGGVTAGIDFALSLVAEISGPDVAQAIQLQIEYAPAPPFEAGSPETAPPAILARLRERNAATARQRREAVEAAAQRLAAHGV
jgi:transcriptional regulator GlxA family with amidase domain